MVESETRKVSYIDLQKQHRTLMPEILAAIRRVLERSDFILGEEVKQFEAQIATYCGTKFAIGVNSGADALLFALKAYGIGQSDEVITAPNSFLATAAMIVAAGARPVFVDVAEDMNIDPTRIEEKITSRTKAIIPVHLTGKSADMDPLMEIARRHNLRVIEDAAQAIGAEYKGKRVGSLGDVGCFSLHPLKNLNVCGDGGIITTDDEKLATTIRLLRNHGLVDRDRAVQWGYNSRLDTLHAAVALVKMRYLDNWTRRRQSHAQYYRDHLGSIVTVPKEQPQERAVYHTFVIHAERRDELKNYCASRGIDTKIHYPIPIHLQEAAAMLGYKRGDFPVCEKQAQQILSIPIHPDLSEEDLSYVCNTITAFYGG